MPILPPPPPPEDDDPDPFPDMSPDPDGSWRDDRYDEVWQVISEQENRDRNERLFGSLRETYGRLLPRLLACWFLLSFTMIFLHAFQNVPFTLSDHPHLVFAAYVSIGPAISLPILIMVARLFWSSPKVPANQGQETSDRKWRFPLL